MLIIMLLETCDDLLNGLCLFCVDLSFLSTLF